MKRKYSLIEVVNLPEQTNCKINYNCNFITDNMYKNTIWYKSLLSAEKTCLKEDKIKKIHYKFDDDKEMVEEYNTETQVMIRRTWKLKGKLGGEGKWLVEIGDPMPDQVSNTDNVDIMECKDQVRNFFGNNGVEP